MRVAAVGKQAAASADYLDYLDNLVCFSRSVVTL
jgi:hypothetical protein